MGIWETLGLKKKVAEPEKGPASFAQEMTNLNKELDSLRRRRDLLQEDMARERHPQDAELLESLGLQIQKKEERLRQLARVTI